MDGRFSGVETFSAVNFGAASIFSYGLQMKTGFAMQTNLGTEKFLLAGCLALFGAVVAILPA